MPHSKASEPRRTGLRKPPRYRAHSSSNAKIFPFSIFPRVFSGCLPRIFSLQQRRYSPRIFAFFLVFCSPKIQEKNPWRKQTSNWHFCSNANPKFSSRIGRLPPSAGQREELRSIASSETSKTAIFFGRKRPTNVANTSAFSMAKTSIG